MAGDRREYLELLRISEEFHRPWKPAPAPGSDPFGDAVFQSLIERNRTETSSCTFLCRRTDGAILASLNLSNIVRGAFHCAFLGYWTGAPHANRGYMREGIELMLRHAFGRLELHRLEANIIPTNAPSKQLVKRAGFRLEGLSPRYLKIAGSWQDHERWAITIEDWAK